MVGASGFGREALDVLEAMQREYAPIEIVGVVDDSPSGINLRRLQDRGMRYLGTIDNWLARGNSDTQFVLGIGNPQVRRRLIARMDALDRKAFAAVHPSAQIGSRVLFGVGVVVCAGVVISTNARVGRHVHVNPNATIGHDCALGDFVSVNPAAVISGEVHIGADTLVGASATILQGLTVGDGVVIGAGAVVTKNVPNGVTVKGVPGTWIDVPRGQVNVGPDVSGLQ